MSKSQYPEQETLELKPVGRKKTGAGTKFERLKFSCGECGMVYDMAFAIEENGNLGMAQRPNARATAGRRRKGKFPKR